MVTYLELNSGDWVDVRAAYGTGGQLLILRTRGLGPCQLLETTPPVGAPAVGYVDVPTLVPVYVAGPVWVRGWCQLRLSLPSELPATALAPPGQVSLLQLSITNPVTPAALVVTGTGNHLVIPPTGYLPVLNHYKQVLLVGVGIGVTATGLALIQRDMLLKIDAYVDAEHSANNATVGVVFYILRGGSTVFSARAVHSKMPSGADIGNIAGTGTLNALAGDQVGIALASDLSGTVRIHASSLVYHALS